MLLADLLLILPGRHAIVFFELFGKVGIIAEAHRVGDHGNGQILPLQQLSGKANALLLNVFRMFVSLYNPYHLQDVPAVKVYINAYTPTKVNVLSVIDKICGVSQFKGQSPVDAFCGLPDTRY